MKILLISLIIALTLSGCNPCEHIVNNRGPLSDELLSLIPYEQGQYINFKHSGGLIISWFVKTKIEQERMCEDHYCCEELIFEKYTATLMPDYPVFSFNFQINNADTSHYPIWVSIGKYSCIIPDQSDPSDIDVADSLLINGVLYRDVYRVKYHNDMWNSNDILRVDSMMYNHDLGIIKVVMTNGEYYIRNE